MAGIVCVPILPRLPRQTRSFGLHVAVLQGRNDTSLQVHAPTVSPQRTIDWPTDGPTRADKPCPLARTTLMMNPHKDQRWLATGVLHYAMIAHFSKQALRTPTATTSPPRDNV